MILFIIFSFNTGNFQKKQSPQKLLYIAYFIHVTNFLFFSVVIIHELDNYTVIVNEINFEIRNANCNVLINYEFMKKFSN